MRMIEPYYHEYKELVLITKEYLDPDGSIWWRTHVYYLEVEVANTVKMEDPRTAFGLAMNVVHDDRWYAERVLAGKMYLQGIVDSDTEFLSGLPL